MTVKPLSFSLVIQLIEIITRLWPYSDSKDTKSRSLHLLLIIIRMHLLYPSFDSLVLSSKENVHMLAFMAKLIQGLIQL